MIWISCKLALGYFLLDVHAPKMSITKKSDIGSTQVVIIELTNINTSWSQNLTNHYRHQIN